MSDLTGAASVNLAEEWHYVGKVGEPAFQNSWTNVGPGLPQLAFRIREAGVVDIQGTVDNGASGTTIFTLPAGYRPSAVSYAPLASLDGSAKNLLIGSSGAVQAYFGTVGDAMYINVQVFLDPPAVA